MDSKGNPPSGSAMEPDEVSGDACGDEISLTRALAVSQIPNSPAYDLGGDVTPALEPPRGTVHRIGHTNEECDSRSSLNYIKVLSNYTHLQYTPEDDDVQMPELESVFTTRVVTSASDVSSNRH